MSTRERAIAALRGVAVGDAFGRSTEGYWPEDIATIYGERIASFVKPVELMDHSRGETPRPSRMQRWNKAEITDDSDPFLPSAY